jgi:ketosteroid isomerase-like protein
MRIAMINIFIVLITWFMIVGCGDQDKMINREVEIREITRVIDSCIGWFKTKDFELYFSAVAHDSNFIAVHPTNKMVRGFEQVLKNSQIFKRPEFQYVRHEIKDLTINLSRSGDVAWFYCMLNDINTWDGQPANWENTRWTGVLEKRDGRWVIVQQHFSFEAE